jgi:hypothetical protein
MANAWPMHGWCMGMELPAIFVFSGARGTVWKCPCTWVCHAPKCPCMAQGHALPMHAWAICSKCPCIAHAGGVGSKPCISHVCMGKVAGGHPVHGHGMGRSSAEPCSPGHGQCMGMAAQAMGIHKLAQGMGIHASTFTCLPRAWAFIPAQAMGIHCCPGHGHSFQPS